jgi:hypothetical protein
MSNLADQRCWHHPVREAVVRCPECRRFYCRECVVEHRGRMMCTGCVSQEGRGSARSARFPNAVWIPMALGGLLVAWLIFYYLGWMLARIPSDFFSGPA